VVFGDSHTFALLPALEHAARREGRQGFFVSANGCLPFIGVINIRGCAALNARVLEYVRRERIPRIILAGRWSYYTDGDRNGVMRK
jgi:SGNH domain-containing protein